MAPDDPVDFHRMLLNDPARMDAYRRAISQTIVPGATVLDAGSGTGILAMFACQAGAGRVYAIDSGPVIEVARQLAMVNGFSDRIVFLQREIKQARLPERVDVIISELIAKAVLGECMAESLAWCRENFLKPGGRMIPVRVDLFIAPIEDPKAFRRTLLPEAATYSIDFSPLRAHSFNRPISSKVAATSLLAAGQIAYSYIAAEAPPVDTFDTTLTFASERKGTLHGLVAWFSSTLMPGVSLDNHPPGTASWDNLVFPLPEPVSIEAGTSIRLRFRGRCDTKMPEMWAWNTTVQQGSQTMAKYEQSTFWSEMLTRELLRPIGPVVKSKNSGDVQNALHT